MFGIPNPSTGLFTPTTTNTTTTTSSGFQLSGGDNKAQTKPALNLFAAPTATTASTGFNFGVTFGTPSSTATSLGTTSAPALNLSSSTTTAAAPYSLTTTTASSTFAPILNTSASTATSVATTTAAKLTFGLGTVSSAPSTGTTTTSAAAPASTPKDGSMTFTQLEESINKWTIDLEEQGKFFINQAKQLNAWDTLLISNGEKILNINGSIERVKQQQAQLNQELDFVLAQQNELEELITPLEKELIDLPVSDIDRNQMYMLSEHVDSQLKQMSDDLKEIIEHINESHKEEEMSNPVTQISKILNAHMNSLQWIDRQSTQISNQLEQITKLQDSNRRNSSFLQ